MRACRKPPRPNSGEPASERKLLRLHSLWHPRIGAGGIALLLAGLVGAASAQTPYPVSVSLGTFLPGSSDTRHRAGNALLTADIRYALPPSTGAATRTLLGGSVAHGTRGEGSTLVSGTVGQVFSLTPGRSPLVGQTGYVGVGGWIYGLDINGRHAFGRLGAYGEVGYNVTDRLFAAARYQVVDQGNGLGLTAGVRF